MNMANLTYGNDEGHYSACFSECKKNRGWFASCTQFGGNLFPSPVLVCIVFSPVVRRILPPVVFFLDVL
ncbi:MAG TPA: hypothetical protein DCW68_01805 [Rhodospirillaceae bacterium]|nr:MAG: hypothetical protein A2018_04770 [Alphaproteobacteria bacterium GWF2_58_20]HAU28831.1 hypothetical protein [Rhodospirillaceae bacterium]